MTMLKRILRHLTSTSATARRAFPTATLSALQAAIGDGESQHRAQLRLIIEPALDMADLLHHVSTRGRAHALFSRYRIWDTEENCGVLIYINLADHAVEIVTDRAVGRAVPREQWEAACRTMTQGFAGGRFHESALAGVAHVNGLLQTHFPARDGGARHNELSDRPVIL
jgi:uncharacterized membrane protein